MTLAELRAAVKARGFDDLTDAQVDQLVNDACVELDAMYPWPYREKSVTGTPAPLLIPDLGQVDEVIDLDNNSQVLSKVAWDEIAYLVGDTSIGALPLFWYFASPEGVLQIATFPESDHDLGVQYWCQSPVLSADVDEPLCPSAWHSVIVDIAAGAGYMDGETPPGLQARIDRRVQQMVNSLMVDYGPTYVSPFGDDC